jgi:hypothetical protein
MSAADILLKCGEIQKVLFFENFMTHLRPGEIMCINEPEWGDTLIFEHWRIHGIDFILNFKLLSEDSLIARGINPSYTRHEVLLEEKTLQQRDLHAQFLERLRLDGKTLDQVKKQFEQEGRDGSLLDFKEYTREMLEERLTPGKKTIQGDRNSNVEVLERQKEIPSDLQRPRLNQYFLTPPSAIEDLKALDGLEETIFDEKVEEWKALYLEPAPKAPGLRTTYPLFKEVVSISPRIYSFPDKELQID